MKISPLIFKILNRVISMEKSDYEKMIYSQKYQNSNELLFDKDENQTWIRGQARFILVWRNMKRGVCYAPKF